MTLIDEFEAAGMSEIQFLKECWERDFTYQDYLTNCELLKRVPVSERLFEGHMMIFTERDFFNSL